MTRAPSPLFSVRRVYAMVLRHLYLMRGSWARVVEMAYWPILNVVMWGFMTQFLMGNSSWVAQASGVLIGAVILWDILFRANLGLSLSFLEEMWSRNLGHLSVSPLTPVELVTALVTMSLIRTVVGMLPAMLLAIPLYHYSIFSMGLPLLAFFVNLMVTGWGVGLGVAALVLRFGLGAESLAWVVIFALAPISGIYYPVATLPPWLQTVAWFLPSSHVFEGMRAVMFTGAFPAGEIVTAAALNVVFLLAMGGLFLRVYHIARVRGLFLSMGE